MVWKFVHCTVFFMCCVWVFGTLVPSALLLLFFKICSYVCALCTVLNVFCMIIWYFSPYALFWIRFVRFEITLVFYAPFCVCSVWLFGALVPCARFWMCSVRFVVTLVYCAPFWTCSLWLFGTLVLRALFLKCSVRVVFMCYVTLCVVFECLVG